MKAVKLYGVQDLRLEEVPIPELNDEDEVLIKVKCTGICGSDISRYSKLGAKYKEGLTFGHEFSGVIEKVGNNVKNFKAGDHVCCCPTMPCFECEYCKKGEYARCETLEVIGARRDGCFAEYVTLPAKNCLHVDESLDFEQVAMIEPGTVVVHGLYRTEMKPGDDVTVVGCGPIGLLAVIWAKAFGARRIIAMDVFDEKLEWAKQCGATDVFNSKEEDPVKKVFELTNNRGTDIVIEAAGTPFTSAQVLEFGCKGAKVLYLGIPYGDVPFSRTQFEKVGRREQTIYGAWNSVDNGFPGKPYETSIAFLENGKIDYKPLVTHRYNLGELPDVFKKIYKRDTIFGKIMIYPEGVKENHSDL